MRPVFLPLALLFTTAAAGAEFRGLSPSTIAGTFPYTLSSPTVTISAISDDGSTVGGWLTQTGVIFDCASFECGRSAFVWSHDQGERTDLGVLSIGSGFGQTAYPLSVAALSEDGSTALATYEFRHYESALHRADGAVALRDPIAIGQWLQATDMSSDASVVVGTLGDAPFRWTEGTGLVELSGLDTAVTHTPAAVSGDGRVVLLSRSSGGLTPPAGGRLSSIRWTPDGAPSEFVPATGFAVAAAVALSHDGSLAVGNSYPDGAPTSLWEVNDGAPDATHRSQATRWQGDVAQTLAAAFPTGSSWAMGVSANGEVVVGAAHPGDDGTAEAVLWKDDTAFLVRDLLAGSLAAGGSLDGWRLTSATAVSADGTVVAGHGIDPSGAQAGWVALLTAPEPGAIALAGALLLSGGATGRIRRR